MIDFLGLKVVGKWFFLENKKTKVLFYLELYRNFIIQFCFMDVVGKKILEKLKRKNKGNVLLVSEIDDLITTLEENEFKNQL